MSKLRNTWRFLCHHKYLVTIILFIAIVGFLDSNSYYNLYKQRVDINDMENEIQIYKMRYQKDTRTVKQLDARPKAMEKIARERYFMKKPNEDVYIFSE